MAISKFSVTVLTNGSLIKSHIPFLSKLKKKNRLHFSVSLDSGNPEVNKLTRGEGAFYSSLEGIKLLIQMGYQVTVLSTVTNKYSVKELETLAEVISMNGGKQINLTPLQPVGLAKNKFDEMRPSNELLNALSACIPELTQKYGINIGTGFEKCYTEEEKDNKQTAYLLPCRAGITQISIRVNGDVYPCNSLEIYMGNILKDSIDFILNESEGAIKINQLSKKTIKEHPMCNNCKYADRCTGGCRGVAFGYTGDLYAPDIYCDQLVLKS